MASFPRRLPLASAIIVGLMATDPALAQDSGDDFVAITVTFKEFGISLAFTPTVVGEDLINLVVNPEVSNINPALGVTLAGSSIPGPPCLFLKEWAGMVTQARAPEGAHATKGVDW